MTLHILYDQDAQPALLHPIKIAILGYGSQGRAHALNLRDSDCHVIVAQRPRSQNHAAAVQDGFAPTDIPLAVEQADLLIFALPDEAMPAIYVEQIACRLRAGQTLGFIHGFAIRFGNILPPRTVDVIMVAPKGPGPLVRRRFQEGAGVPCLIAVHQDATGGARQLALAWGAGIGGGRAGMIETTFAVECETDLFGEQAVLCGGIIELMKAAYEALIEAGYPEEAAYFECIHEAKQIVDLVYTEGLAGMRSRISRTAAYGGLSRGPQLVTAETKETLRAILSAIRSGRFAEEWMDEHARGKPNLEAWSRREANHPSQRVGRLIRSMGCRPPPDEIKC